MSAICGIYYYDGRTIRTDVSESMMRELRNNHIDASAIWSAGQLFFGCHAQHITPESVTETLPYHDALAGLTITADAIIDNRAELFETISIEYSRRDSIPDSLLILEAYQKWGRDCPKYLVGDFAFAIWDENQRELFCAVDHTGSRTFYYYQSKDCFAFSTLLNPLFVMPEIIGNHNETWLADFLASPAVESNLDAELTIYKDIYLLTSGAMLTVSHNGLQKQVYWQAIPQKKLKLNSNHEYDEAFREVFGEAVRSCMRSIRPVGAMMSGGLDSTAMAAMMAQNLRTSGQRLQVFSSVPISGYRDYLPSSLVADETPYIEAVREHVGNIDVTYCSLEGKHSLSETDRLLAIMEQPYKTIENLFWIDGVAAAAQKKNIGVLLHGSAGNLTVSWGNMQGYLLHLLQEGQWWKLIRQIRDRSKRYKQPLRAVLKMITPLFPCPIQKMLYKKKVEEIYDISPINPEFYRRSHVGERLKKCGYDNKSIRRVNSLEMRINNLNAIYFSQMGVAFTKLGLQYGMIVRDPCRDKRVIEFCLSLPEDQFVHNGCERMIIRRAMEGLVPNIVLHNDIQRGKQSADLAQRLQSLWPAIVGEIGRIGSYAKERQYLNIDKIKKTLVKYNELKDDATMDFDFLMLMRSLIFSRYLKQDAGKSTVGKVKL